MYIESELLSKCGNINLARNKRSASTVIGSKANPLEDQFDLIRQSGLATKYNFNEVNSLGPLLVSTNMNEWIKSVPTNTIRNISSNLNKYIQIQNDFSNTEKIFHADKISKFLGMPQNIHTAQNLFTIKGSLKQHTHERENKTNFLSKISNKMFKHQVNNNYQIQKSIYEILRSQSNFTNHKKDIEESGYVRRFNANSESFKSSWIDRGVVQKTSNLESTKFDLINNAKCLRPSFKSILYGSSIDCHKVKSISEFCDISSVKSPKKFNAYHQFYFSKKISEFVQKDAI